MSNNFGRSSGFRKSTTSSMPNRFPAPSEQMPNTVLLSSTPTVNGGGNVSTSIPNRFSAPSEQMPNPALLSSTLTVNGGGNVSTSMSNLSVASKSTEVKCVDWPENVGRATPMRGEQFGLARDMKVTFNNAKLLKQIVDQNAEKASSLVRELPCSLFRPQSQAGHQPTQVASQPLASNRSAVGGGFHADPDTSFVRSDIAARLRQKLSSDIATGATAPANTQPHVDLLGFKKPRDPVTMTPELSALEQMKNAGLKPGVNPNKVFYERSDSSISPTSTETSRPKRIDTISLELAKMRRLQEIMKAIQISSRIQ
ncbi:unnamed protein product, partial [Mesorhabditis belari]|uniref:Uncharacterized protein n=1 Tax=Mesorhabditis belari TaxID=2138241 RepID=A0AAF3F1D9_9BILA